MHFFPTFKDGQMRGAICDMPCGISDDADVDAIMPLSGIRDHEPICIELRVETRVHGLRGALVRLENQQRHPGRVDNLRSDGRVLGVKRRWVDAFQPLKSERSSRENCFLAKIATDI